MGVLTLYRIFIKVLWFSNTVTFEQFLSFTGKSIKTPNNYIKRRCIQSPSGDIGIYVCGGGKRESRSVTRLP